MADPADLGNEAAELFLDIAHKNRRREEPQAGIGMCLNCGASLDDDRRWCDSACRDDHTRYTKGH